MPNYEQGKIYRLVNNTTDNCYYGSTCIELRKRKYQHKSKYLTYLKDQKKFLTSFKIFEPDIYNVDIILVEQYPCSNKQELHARERWYIENHDCVNKVIPTRTLKEYYMDNRDKINERQKEYYKENKDKIRDYYKENKDKISEKEKAYRQANKDNIREKKKAYWLANKDRLSEQKKAYRQSNKEKIREREEAYRLVKKEKLCQLKNSTAF